MTITNKETFKHSPQIGWIPLTERFAIQGTNKRLQVVNVALEAKDLKSSISIEPEPDNEYDENALKVMVKKTTFIFSTYFHIGYVPAELAGIICKHGLQHKIRIRILRVITYDNGNKAVICDLIGQSRYLDNKTISLLTNYQR